MKEENLEDRVSKAAEVVSPLSGDVDKMIDLGCGDGNATSVIGEKVGAKEVFGVDIDEEAVESAKQRGIDARLSDLSRESLPFPDDHFDLVISIEVIEHIYDTDHFLSEVKRVLRPGGHFLLTTPNLGWWINRLALMVGYQPFFTNLSKTYDVGKLQRRPCETGCEGSHIRLFTSRALEEFLNIHGFKVQSIRGCSLDILPKWLGWIDRLISKVPSVSANLVLLCRKKPQ